MKAMPRMAELEMKKMQAMLQNNRHTVLCHLFRPEDVVWKGILIEAILQCFQWLCWKCMRGIASPVPACINQCMTRSFQSCLYQVQWKLTRKATHRPTTKR